MTLDTLVSSLNACKKQGKWQRIAERSKVDYGTLSRIARGAMRNPGIATCERIEAAIRDLGADVPLEAKAA